MILIRASSIVVVVVAAGLVHLVGLVHYPSARLVGGFLRRFKIDLSMSSLVCVSAHRPMHAARVDIF